MTLYFQNLKAFVVSNVIEYDNLLHEDYLMHNGNVFM
jgi:hypothetical protein